MLHTLSENLIREGKSHQLDSIIQTGKKEGMMTLDDSLLALYMQKDLQGKLYPVLA